MGISWASAILFPVDPTRWYLTKGMWPRYDDWFADLFHYDTTFAYLHSQTFFTYIERFAYPAPSAVVYYFFIQSGSHRLAVFLLLALWAGIISALLLARGLFRNGVGKIESGVFALVLLLTSWPFLFLLERANIEIVVLYLTLGGSLAYWKGQLRTSAVFWGLAASLKIYPVVLLALFLKRKLSVPLLAGLISFATSMGLSFWWVGPSIRVAALGSFHGTAGFVSSYAYHARAVELTFDHSFLAAIKSPLAIHRLHVSSWTMRLIGRFYIGAVLLLACVAFYVRVRHLPRFNQFAILMIAMVALPPVSYDYTLCPLYPTFGLTALVLVRTQKMNRVPPGLKQLFWCFLVLFTSQTVVFYQSFHPNGLIKFVALLISLSLLLRYPINDDLIMGVLSPPV